MPGAVTADQRPPLALPLSVPLLAPPDFAARLAAIGVSLGASTMAQLGDFLARMLAMNEQMNLTSIRDPEEAWDLILGLIDRAPHNDALQ